MEIEVPSVADGARLDAFLAQSLGSRTRAQRLIEAELVTIGGKARPKRQRLRTGDRIRIREPIEPDTPPGPQTADTSVPVVFEDAHLLVVDKPAGLVVHPARGHRTGTLSQALADRGAKGGEALRAGIVHRLDRDTSGLLVVAKSEAVHRTLKAALAARGVGREYLALVDGRPSARSGTIEAAIGRDRRVPTRVSTNTDAPREARTHFWIERALPECTLLRVRLDTGRTHQIRVHLGAIGHPVCGDPQYGRPGALGLTRQFLHASRIVFEHPVNGKRLDISSPLPPDLAEALERARG